MHPSRIPHAVRKTGVLDAILCHTMKRSESRGGTKNFIPWNKEFQRLKHLKQLSIDLKQYMRTCICTYMRIRTPIRACAYTFARLCACTRPACVYVYYNE